ncbi:hypothetical protein [Bacillus nitratireducens]|uniref:hypothetical protein n=1 Tax=Bacillus nitratireducens TaxID=2026193 RepID=UPI001596C1A9|nr:hypothetical protein [Bacillus nitratireducens]MED0906664.1 hypothetical protein [Bacillus nitratireducens]
MGCLNGYLVGTLITLLMVYFGYRISEMNKAAKWHDESVLKKMEQLKALRDDKR